MADIQSTLQNIQELRVDALFGKKKHYNAADRKEKYNLFCGLPIVVVNVLMSSLLFWIMSDSVPTLAKLLGAILGLVAALLGAIQTFFNFQRLVEGHRRIASRYLAVAKACSRQIAYIKDGNYNSDNIVEQLEKLARECDEINKDAETYPTSKKDYLLARQGMNDGEEIYTPTEISHKGE